MFNKESDFNIETTAHPQDQLSTRCCLFLMHPKNYALSAHARRKFKMHGPMTYHVENSVATEPIALCVLSQFSSAQFVN